MRKSLVGVLALAGSLLFALAEYSRLPSRIPTHWDLHSHVNGYGPRGTVLLIPAVAIVLFPLLGYVLPRIDPHHANYNKHEGSYWVVWNAVMVFVALVGVFVVGASLGWRTNVGLGVPLLVGLLFLVLGNVLGRFRPNWFVGIRTPWTLSSDEVWRKTHRIGSRTFVAAGLLLVAAAFLPYEWTKAASIAAAVAIGAGVPTAYSYFEWRKLGRPERA